MTPSPELTLIRTAVIEALDEATVLRDLLGLVYWAGESIPGPRGAALARGALLAQDRLDLLVAHLEAARGHVRDPPTGVG